MREFVVDLAGCCSPVTVFAYSAQDALRLAYARTYGQWRGRAWQLWRAPAGVRSGFYGERESAPRVWLVRGSRWQELPAW